MSEVTNRMHKLISYPQDDFTRTIGWYFSVGVICLYFIAACAYGCAYVFIPSELYYPSNVNNESTREEDEKEGLEKQAAKKRDLAANIVIQTVVPDEQYSEHTNANSKSNSLLSQSHSKILSSMTHSVRKFPFSMNWENHIIDMESTPLSSVRSECDYYESISPSSTNNGKEKYNKVIDSNCTDERSIYSTTSGSSNTRKRDGDSVQIGTLHTSVCGICLDNYKVGETIAYSHHMNCIHCYHEDCILEWLLQTRQKTCPECRRDFLLPEEV